MPCEVVACIVVLPLPVGSLLVCLGRFVVDIYFCGFGAILPNSMIFCRIPGPFAEFKKFLPNSMNSLHFPWICIDLSQCMKLHVTVK